MYGFVYLVTSNRTGETYVGLEKSAFVPKNYMGNGKSLKEAVRRDGKNNFQLSILEECDTHKELEDALAAWTDHYAKTGYANNPNKLIMRKRAKPTSVYLKKYWSKFTKEQRKTARRWKLPTNYRYPGRPVTIRFEDGTVQRFRNMSAAHKKYSECKYATLTWLARRKAKSYDNIYGLMVSYE